MPYAVTKFQPTPNPNALKCILDRPIPEPIRSFRSAAQASGDPLGAAIFAIPGVQTLLLSGAWITVNKHPEVEWAGIKKGLAEVLGRA